MCISNTVRRYKGILSDKIYIIAVPAAFVVYSSSYFQIGDKNYNNVIEN